MAIKSLQLRIQDFPLGALVRWGEGRQPLTRAFLAKIYAKTKELGPVWGGGAGFANALIFNIGLKIQ